MAFQIPGTGLSHVSLLQIYLVKYIPDDAQTIRTDYSQTNLDGFCFLKSNMYIVLLNLTIFNDSFLLSLATNSEAFNSLHAG